MSCTCAIVGADFSGMAVAVQLLRRLQQPARLCLINRSLSFGRGLAYGTNSPSHLLNVPAGRMSIDPEEESGFVDYLKSRGRPYKASDFVPRSVYGDYLERCLLRAQAWCRPTSSRPRAPRGAPCARRAPSPRRPRGRATIGAT